MTTVRIAELAARYPAPGADALVPTRPRVVNYQVNDVCNARCVMCFIWKNRKRLEIEPAEFGAMLGNEFFSEVEHLGITGGEPTLRPDLADYYLAALDRLPKLRGGHFITNGFSTARALDTFPRVRDRYAERGVGFAGMVSIDGVAQVHDRVRGRIGSFRRSERTLLSLRDAGVQTIACCTIVRDNVYGLHDLLDWGRRHGVYVRFRIAEFIQRLYNESAVDQIRAFDRAELRHLVSFFHLLRDSYEPSPDVRRTYESILSLLSGGVRLTRCPYQSSLALNIDSLGRFAHCAPKGQPHELGAVPIAALRQHVGERESIHRDHCPSCIHDYHAEWTGFQQWLKDEELAAERAWYPPVASLEHVQPVAPQPFDPAAVERVALAGWYGTETAGDIAILGGIVSEYLRANPRLQFRVFSLYPHYTRTTIGDLGPERASRISVVPYFGPLADEAIRESDAVVMAGGPLMDIEPTRLIAGLFRRFEEMGRPRVVEGCGLGPLNVDQYRRNVAAVVRRATCIRVRDQASRRLALRLGAARAAVRDDPAVTWIRESGQVFRGTSADPIRCFLRELTSEYPQATTPEDAAATVRAFVHRLAGWYPGRRIELWPMHYFPIGNDDRQFARGLAAEIGNRDVVAIERACGPAEVLEAMATASFCVCMRFHSVVFADQIGAPYLAIDYTAGGKIAAYLADRGKAAAGVGFTRLASLSKRELEALVGEAAVGDALVHAAAVRP